MAGTVFRAVKRFAIEAVHPPLGGVSNLEAYMARYGQSLAQQAQESLRPLHVPGRDEPIVFKTKRQPFPAQAHLITAAVKHLDGDKSVIVSAECGTGKSLMMMLTAHEHARGKPYVGLIMCPGQLTNKWERELRETLPQVDVHQIRNWRDAVKVNRTKPTKPTWYIVPRDRAKRGPGWKPAYLRRPGTEGVCCPACFQQVIDEKTQAPISLAKLSKNKLDCPNCESPLWQHVGKPRRWAPAKFLKDHRKRHFDYFIADELHQLKGNETAQGNSLAMLAAASKHFIGGTGTIIGGLAEHLRSILWRVAPASLVADGFEWNDYMPFNERYGRIETRITEKESKGDDNKQSAGSKRNVAKSVRPGIMPTLFGRHLIDRTVFLSLEDVAEGLPAYEEILVPVEMDAETAAAYKMIEERLREALTPMVARGDRRLLGRMLSILLGYPDHPHGFGSVGYMDGDEYVHVVDCPNLDPKKLRPKEKALLEMLARERSQGNQTWTYCQMTDKRDVMARLAELAGGQGLRSNVLRSKEVDLEDREEWIAKHGPVNDCIFSHPQLVETGLDLFDKCGGHNFNALAFYEQGYNPFVMRQAARRAWRIGQKKPCRVYYFYYVGTMQERAMTLMGKKFSASLALEGKFSSEGLAAMAGDDASMEMALAKSLSEKLDDFGAEKHWEKISVHAGGYGKPAVQLDSRPVGDNAFPVKPFAPSRPSVEPEKPARRTTGKPKPLYRQRVLSQFD